MTGLARPGMDLQSALAASSADASIPGAYHHPLTCKDGRLAFDEAGRFSCDHAAVGPDDPRTRQAIDHSIAILIIEEGLKL